MENTIESFKKSRCKFTYQVERFPLEDVDNKPVAKDLINGIYDTAGYLVLKTVKLDSFNNDLI